MFPNEAPGYEANTDTSRQSLFCILYIKSAHDMMSACSIPKIQILKIYFPQDLSSYIVILLYGIRGG